MPRTPATPMVPAMRHGHTDTAGTDRSLEAGKGINLLPTTTQRTTPQVHRGAAIQAW
jgi:hypothetical protein